MIKKVAITICFGLLVFVGRAQHMQSRVNTYSDEGAGTGFRKENLFVGGGLGLGFGSYDFNVGVNPEVGYSLNRWLDAGLVANFNYSSMKNPYNTDDRVHVFSYGGGAFGRAWFLPFLFVNVQPEVNWLSQKEKVAGTTIGSYNATAGSLLLGIGYGQRAVGQSTFYIAVMFDAISNVNSPYNDINGHPLPVIRAGFDIFVHKH